MQLARPVMQDPDPEKKKLRKVELLYLSSPEGRKIFPPDGTRLMIPATAVETEASTPQGTALLLTILKHFYYIFMFVKIRIRFFSLKCAK